MTKEFRPFYNVGPGEIIQDSLDALGWRQEDLAELTGLSLQSVNKLIQNKQSITVETANLLAKVFNTTPEIWLNLDTAHQLRKHKSGEREALAGKKARMRKYMPLSEMRKKGWMLFDNTADGLERECQRLFGKDDPPEEVYEKAEEYCARRGKTDEAYTAWYSKTWYLVAQKYAEGMVLPRFERKKLQALAESLSTFTLEEGGLARFLAALNACGVGFFMLSHLQKTYLDGAAFYCGKNPFIVYTARYDRVDNFWFTVAHELGHILDHLKPSGTPILDDLDNEGLTEMEKEADARAAEYLHIEEIINEGQKIGTYLTAERMAGMSAAIGVSAPVIVGVLQHRKIIEWRQFTRYRETVLDKIPEEYVKG
jgi:HTH-type transcriptional regulator / antitoxin HigA